MGPPRTTLPVAGQNQRGDPSAAEAARAFDQLPFGMLLVDAAGAIRHANPACAELLGHAPADLTRQTLADLIHPSDESALDLQFERLVRGEISSLHGEHRFSHADASPLWVQVGARSFESADDTSLFVLQLANIETHKKAEEALIYTEKRWRFALQSARQGVWDYDYRTDSIFYSDGWRRIRGYSPDEWVDGATAAWHSRIHPDDLPVVKANIDRQEQSDDTFEGLEYRERRKDGSYVWILSRGRAVEWTDAGEPLRTIGTDTDITHLKMVEQELDREKERLRIILSSVADGMISVDAEGRVDFMNAAAEQLTGVSAAAARGEPIEAIFRLQDHTSGAPMDCPVRSSLAQGLPIRVEDDAELISHDGTRRDIRCTAAPVLGSADDVLGAVLIFQDMTQSRALQRQLAHTASHDPLTDLTNRAAFEKALARTIAEARETGKPSCLIFIDLDHFKPVNDTAGHAAGDALLKRVAQTIRDCCRSHDTVARIGGDEFAVILDCCPEENGLQVGQKIVRAISALAFDWGGKTHRVSASAGLTIITPEPPSAIGFLGEADAACYPAKAEGRGRIISYGEAIAGQP
ncbi:PAS domain S-box protein [Devosia sp. SD17-2]|uniref:PAS domain S-box protein n=1 Tax=Devosia sp. SD17-2 TaxID=2976459 RepID=UPI0023D7F06A|nr:PAS domain S-box protein [Devosia sp. SD17-2]WEJ33069.1 PAS domain S-box protein [Devosia sp. SD17-2]